MHLQSPLILSKTETRKFLKTFPLKPQQSLVPIRVLTIRLQGHVPIVTIVTYQLCFVFPSLMCRHSSCRQWKGWQSQSHCVTLPFSLSGAISLPLSLSLSVHACKSSSSRHARHAASGGEVMLCTYSVSSPQGLHRGGVRLAQPTVWGCSLDLRSFRSGESQ